MPTIRNVAQHAGLSPTTVSEVMNDTSHGCPDTGARIQTAIQELNFKPEDIAVVGFDDRVGLSDFSPASPRLPNPAMNWANRQPNCCGKGWTRKRRATHAW